jgi:hypothetical protein
LRRDCKSGRRQQRGAEARLGRAVGRWRSKRGAFKCNKSFADHRVTGAEARLGRAVGAPAPVAPLSPLCRPSVALDSRCTLGLGADPASACSPSVWYGRPSSYGRPYCTEADMDTDRRHRVPSPPPHPLRIVSESLTSRRARRRLRPSAARSSSIATRTQPLTRRRQG